MRKSLQKVTLMCLFALFAIVAKAQNDVTALWDWEHNSPLGICGGSRNLMGISVELCDSKEEKLFICHSMKISSEKFDFSIE